VCEFAILKREIMYKKYEDRINIKKKMSI